MKFTLLCVCIVAFAAFFVTADISDVDAQGLFAKYVERYQKVYEMSDFFKRFGIFKDNLKYIMDHNADAKQTFQVGINQFADLTEEEWNNYKGLKLPDGFDPNSPKIDAEHDVPEGFANRSAATSVNWVEQGMVTPVINQGQCGSCYAWASVGALESAHAIAFGKDKLQQYSPQQIVDCSTQNNGCGGGWMSWTFQFIKQNKGICSAASYPYAGRKQQCKRGCTPVATVTGYVDLSGRPDDYLARAVTLQPVTIAVQSNSRGFMFYKSGIINSQCGSKLDHAIFVVGYGTDTDKNMDYYLVKNSWGTGWGENGYVRIQRKTGNTDDKIGMCGLLTTPSYPVVPKVGA